MQGLDALLPVEIARYPESIGAQKTTLDPTSLFILAGADGVLPFGVGRLLVAHLSAYAQDLDRMI